MSRAHLALRGFDRRTRAVALLLHGGAENGADPVSRWARPPLRMIPFGWAIRRRDRRIAVARLRFRKRGWNGTDEDPLADVADALVRIDARHPGVPVVLVGHSMGGRAALRCAGAPAVVGVVALAPWIVADDPTAQLTGRAVVIVHGTDDRRTSPVGSAAYAERVTGIARTVRYVAVPDGDHAMLRHPRRWHRITADAVTAMVS